MIVRLRASIIPAKAKFERKKAPQHFIKALNDFAPNAAKTIRHINKNFIDVLRIGGMFFAKIISENAPPIAEASRNRFVLKMQPVIAAVALSRDN